MGYYKMPEALMSELFKAGILFALLGYIAYALWKKYDAKIVETSNELKELKAKYDKELLQDRIDRIVLIKDTNANNTKMTEAVDKFMAFIENQNRSSGIALERNARVMECLTEEIKKFKKEG